MTHIDNIPTSPYTAPEYTLGLDHLKEKETVLNGWDALETLRKEQISDSEYQEAINTLRNAIAARSQDIFEKMNNAGTAVKKEVGYDTLRVAPDLQSIKLAVDKEDWNVYDSLNYAHNRISELEEEGVLGSTKTSNGAAVSNVESEFVSTGAIWENMRNHLEE